MVVMGYVRAGFAGSEGELQAAMKSTQQEIVKRMGRFSLSCRLCHGGCILAPCDESAAYHRASRINGARVLGPSLLVLGPSCGPRSSVRRMDQGHRMGEGPRTDQGPRADQGHRPAWVFSTAEARVHQAAHRSLRLALKGGKGRYPCTSSFEP